MSMEPEEMVSKHVQASQYQSTIDATSAVARANVVKHHDRITEHVVLVFLEHPGTYSEQCVSQLACIQRHPHRCLGAGHCVGHLRNHGVQLLYHSRRALCNPSGHTRVRPGVPCRRCSEDRI